MRAPVPSPLPPPSALMPPSPENTPSQPASPPPLTLVTLSAVTWDFPLVGRSRMLTEAWLRDGPATLFVQTPSYRTALERVQRWFRPPIADESFVVRPWPTVPARTWAMLGTRRVRRLIAPLARRLRAQLDERLDWRSAVALVISPVWTPWLHELPFARVVYDCIDELAVHVTRPNLHEMYEKWERELIARSAAVVVTAERLGQTVLGIRRDACVRLIRNGVDAERFERLAAGPRPGDVGVGPVVGFVGALYDWVDFALIAEVARAMPDVRFVFVGPRREGGDSRAADGLANVTFLGARPYDAVPAYVAAFDVCWVPFKQNDVALAANPVKIYEYLAVGKPVVSTPVADMDHFGGLIASAASPVTMVAALRAALAGDPAAAAARRRFARANSWRSRAAEYAALAESLLQNRA